jgi:UDPglucose 6-dehydrogenase
MSLIYILESRGLAVEADYWKGVLKVNDNQKYRLITQICKDLEPESTVTLLGFAFKSGTSDTRSTSSALFAATLLSKGYKVKIHDPKVPLYNF